MNTVSFTDDQRVAIESDHKKILCIAGPGSGKSTTLAARIRRVIENGVDPAQIVAITYTNKAAKSLIAKVGQPVGFAGTVHGFCLRMLRDFGTLYGYGARTGVIDEDAALELLKAKADQQGSKETLKNLAELKAKGRPIRTPGVPYTRAQLVVLAYCEDLREAGLLDFDLILSEFLRIMREDAVFAAAIESRFSHIFWDEMQDSAAIDWAIAEEIPIANKFFVGDPDQSIFGFRGASYGGVLAFSKRPDVQVLYLNENFRCGAEICAAANRLIALNPNRLNKRTAPAEANVVGVCTRFDISPNERAEVDDVIRYVDDYANSGDTVAILCRSNAIADTFRQEARSIGLDVEEPEVDTMPPDWPLARALIEFIAQPANNTLAFFYVAAREMARNGVNAMYARAKASQIRREAQAQGKTIFQQWFTHLTPDHPHDKPAANYIGRVLDAEKISRESTALIVELVKNLPAGASLTDLALAVAHFEKSDAKPHKEARVCVTTIHAAKGREFDVVFIAGYEDELTPGHAKTADIEEERRLAFVAITRARRAVFFSSSATRKAHWNNGHNPILQRSPSRFIAEALG